MRDQRTNFPVFSANIAGALLDQGFQIVDRCRNYNEPRLWVYYFEDTPESRAAFNKIMAERGYHITNKSK